MRIRSVLALALGCALAAGCFTVRHSYQGDKLLTSDPDVPGRKTEIVRHFAVRDRQFFWIHGGFPVGEPLNGAALAAREIGDHDAVVNLRLREGQDFQDVLVSHVLCVGTLLCGTWSVWAEGDVADLKEAGR